MSSLPRRRFATPEGKVGDAAIIYVPLTFLNVSRYWRLLPFNIVRAARMSDARHFTFPMGGRMLREQFIIVFSLFF